MGGVKLGPLLGIASFAAIFFGLYLIENYIPPQREKPGFETYIAMHGRKPILAMPGTNTEKARIALAELKISAAGAVAPFSDEVADISHTEIYPYEYLSKLLSLEDARRQMLAQPSEHSSALYHTALISTLDAYYAALTHAVEALSVGIPTRFSSFGGKTGAVYVASVLASGRERIELLRTEEDRRYDCATGNSSRCSEIPAWPNYAKDTLSTYESTSVPATLPPTVEAIRMQLRAHASKLGIPLSDVETVSLMQSSCYPSYRPIYYDISTHRSEVSPAIAGRFTLLNDAFFYETEHIPVNYSQALYKNGAVFSYQPFNLYICQDAGRELGDLLAIRYSRMLLSSSPIALENRFALPALRTLIRAQDAFLEEEIPNQQTYYELVRAIEHALATINEERLLQIFGSREALVRMNEVAQVARTRSAQFELILGYLDDMQTTSYTTGVFDPVRTNVFFMLRAGLSPLLLLANETGPFLPNTSLFYEHATQELAPTGYSLHSYTRDLSERYSLNQLLDMHLEARNKFLQPLVDEFIARRAP